MTNGTRIGRIAVVGVCLIVGVGCVVMVDEHRRESGNVPSEATLSEITPGETTVEWLLAAAGPPASRERLDDEREILRYEWKDDRQEEVAIFLLFQSSRDIRDGQTVLVEARNGIVQRYWVEADRD